MAKKKQSDRRKGDRHKVRRMIGIPADVVDRFAVLAARRERSVAREVKRLMIEEMRKEGLWPLGPGAST